MLAGAVALLLAAAGIVPVLSPPLLRLTPGMLGLVISVGGLGMAWAAQSAMGDSWRFGVDSEEITGLVTSGVFTRVRNVIFTSMITAQAGTVLMTTSWLSLPGLACSSPRASCRFAESRNPYLRATHGQGYLDYTARTGRFYPGRRPTPAASASRRHNSRWSVMSYDHGHGGDREPPQVRTRARPAPLWES